MFKTSVSNSFKRGEYTRDIIVIFWNVEQNSSHRFRVIMKCMKECHEVHEVNIVIIKGMKSINAKKVNNIKASFWKLIKRWHLSGGSRVIMKF